MRPLTGLIALIFLASVVGAQEPDGWESYGHDPGGSRFSRNAGIRPENVAQLKVAWTFRTGDVSTGESGMRKSKFEATPILFNNTLYVSTPFNRVIALDPATGVQKWAFDPKIDLKTRYSESLVSRGVSAWLDPSAREGAACKRRILYGTLDARLIAIDADNGSRCATFGLKGEVDLSKNIGAVEAGEYQITSPPAIINGLVVVGSAIGDNRKVKVERGVVRAFDARSGRQRWSWDPLPRGSAVGAANAWSVISADPARNLVFIPTGSAAPDFYGGERLGANQYANSVVALRASDGKVIWHFQVVHHDLWDYDVASQPLLTEVRRDGGPVPAVVVTTKMGHVFVLHRETGKPLFPVEERKVPASDVPGEMTSITQPFPILPPPLHPHNFSPDQAWGVDEQERLACREQIAALRYEGIFTPPSVKGTMIYPGYVGGVNWGAAAADPTAGLMVTNINQLAFWVRLIPREKFVADRQEARRIQLDAEFAAQAGTPYGMARSLLQSPKGNPCVPPPWSKTVAVDLNAGSIRWETGAGATPMMGGPILTAGGLVFLAGGMDRKIRALDAASGKELWSDILPAGGQSTPMTYALRDGKQYVVIAAGGYGDIDVAMGDYVIAYSLSE
jgi:quinoprotein glucose dehydrogenase